MELNDKQKNLLTLLTVLLLKYPSVDESLVNEKITSLNTKVFFPELCTASEVEEVKKEYFSRHSLTRSVGIGLTDDECRNSPWFAQSKKLNGTRNWDRYHDYLMREKGFNENVLVSLEGDLDQIMDYMGNPLSPKNFARKGLVIGDVQSGKTSTYIGLMNKAADAGYKVIILLTGTIEKLRNQTQERVDYGFLGRDSGIFGERNKKKGKLICEPIGVGKFSDQDLHVCFTDRFSDFTLSHAISVGKLDNFTKNSSVAFVVKKNVAILNLLYEWLGTQNADKDGKINLPMLLIDDEADNASINTKKDPTKTTAINAAIRKLLNQFYKTTYVGFTATPYANVFIDSDIKDDLFPKNFIYVLQTPSNYIGPMGIFSGLEDDFAWDDTSKNETSYRKKGKFNYMLDTIDDFESFLPTSHKKEQQIDSYLPVSLQEAVASFLIANAIRDLRGDINTHRTMLVNVSRFIDIQNELARVMQVFLNRIVRVIKNYGNLSEEEALSHPEFMLLKKVFDERYSNLTIYGCSEKECFSWIEVQRALPDSVATIQLMSINGGNASKRLDYKSNEETGLRLIAVGGLSLSRGLTLEGLIVSYYYRNSKMYDTLMQMGRWFGYRDGYEDLCRVYMSKESQNWYAYIANATEELKHSVSRMVNENKTPLDYSLKVRSDKVALLVTARNKMWTATDYEMLISLNENVEETKYIVNSLDAVTNNYDLIENWLNNLFDEGKTYWSDDNRASNNEYQIKDIEANKIADLIKKYNGSGRNDTFLSDVLSKLILKMENEKPFWDVVIAKGQGEPVTIRENTTVKKVKRKYALTKNKKDIQISGPSAHLSSRDVYKAGLNKEQFEKVIIEAEKKRKEDTSIGKEYSQEEYFAIKERNPLLVIWPIELTSRVESDTTDPESIVSIKNSGKTIFGLSIGFPKVDDSDDNKIRYKINKIAALQLFDIDNDDVDFDEETGVEEEN